MRLVNTGTVYPVLPDIRLLLPAFPFNKVTIQLISVHTAADFLTLFRQRPISTAYPAEYPVHPSLGTGTQ